MLCEEVLGRCGVGGRSARLGNGFLKLVHRSKWRVCASVTLGGRAGSGKKEAASALHLPCLSPCLGAGGGPPPKSPAARCRTVYIVVRAPYLLIHPNTTTSIDRDSPTIRTRVTTANTPWFLVTGLCPANAQSTTITYYAPMRKEKKNHWPKKCVSFHGAPGSISGPRCFKPYFHH